MAAGVSGHVWTLEEIAVLANGDAAKVPQSDQLIVV
jgi:hypothetical protein